MSESEEGREAGDPWLHPPSVWFESEEGEALRVGRTFHTDPPRESGPDMRKLSEEEDRPSPRENVLSQPTEVVTHETDKTLVMDTGVTSIVVIDEATEQLHPAVTIHLPLGHSAGTMTLKAFLTTVKMVMDEYPDYVREAYNL